jgi:hypothetical protein
LHHTKVKADIGVAKVIADLTLKGYVPCLPLSEHQPYDIVVVLDDGSTYKIQVKYATLKENGTIEVKFRTSWADKNGTHIKHYKKGDFDYYAIYCPDKEIVLYIPNSANYPKAIRFEKPTNNQMKFIKWANDYLEIKRESSETICHTPEMVKT